MKHRRTTMIKILSTCGVLAAGLIICLAGTADATVVSPGAACFDAYGSSPYAVHRENGSAGNSFFLDPITLTCPIAADHSIGTRVDFSIVVEDRNYSDAVSCSFNMFDVQGNPVDAFVGLASGISTIGVETLSNHLTTTPTIDHNYAVQCHVPAVGNYISSIRTVSIY